MSFSVIRDTVPPTLTLTALVQGDVHVTWNVEDSDPSTGSGQGSGVDASTCLLEVWEDEGAWQTFSTECAGDDAYDGQPGHIYTFPSTPLRTSRLSASDNVSNSQDLWYDPHMTLPASKPLSPSITCRSLGLSNLPNLAQACGLWYNGYN